MPLFLISRDTVLCFKIGAINNTALDTGRENDGDSDISNDYKYIISGGSESEDSSVMSSSLQPGGTVAHQAPPSWDSPRQGHWIRICHFLLSLPTGIESRVSRCWKQAAGTSEAWGSQYQSVVGILKVVSQEGHV